MYRVMDCGYILVWASEGSLCIMTASREIIFLVLVPLSSYYSTFSFQGSSAVTRSSH